MDLKHHGAKNKFGPKTIFGLRSFRNTSVQLNISAHKVKTKKIFEPKKIWQRKYLDPKIYLTQKIILTQKMFLTPKKNQFLLFRALMVYFWGQDRVQNCSGAYSYSWTTFIFYSSFNSDFRSWLNFEVVFYFLGVLIGYFWVHCGVQKLFWGPPM